MNNDIIEFYRQKFHIPIHYATKDWQINHWDQNGILIGVPTEAEQKKQVQGMSVLYDRSFTHNIGGGEDLKLGRTTVAKVGKDLLILNFNPVCDKSKNYVKQMLDEAIPKMARYVRMQQLSAFTNQVSVVSSRIKAGKQASIDNKQWEINDLMRKQAELHERMASDRMMLKFYSRSEEQLKRKVVRMYLELQKLVPGLYSSFQYKDESIIGETQSISIWHDGYQYHFDPYTVTFHLNTGHIHIEGKDNEVEGYPHPHVSSNDVCWGNIGSTISKLSGQLELHGLFQLIHQFLSTYNEQDPFQRIERWNPDWVGEDECDEYCEWCDESGHGASYCEYCWWCEPCLQYHDSDDEVCPATVPEEVSNEQAA